MKKSFFLLFAALALVNCNKSNDIDISTSIKPKMIISEYEDDNYENKVDTSFIFYNGNKVDYTLNTQAKSTYEYSTYEVIIRQYRKNDQIPWYYTKYLYDTNKRVVKVEFYLNVNSDYHGWTGPKIDSFKLQNYFYKYSYLIDGSVKEQFLFAGSDENKSDYCLYKYDTHGNVVTKVDFNFTSEQYHLNNIDSMEYDNKNHQFKNVEVSYDIPLSSKINNITRIKSTFYSYSWDETNGFKYRDTTYRVTNQVYQYDNNDFPLVMNADGNSHYKSLIIEY